MSKVYEYFKQFEEEEEPIRINRTKMSNSDFIQLSCELADIRIREEEKQSRNYDTCPIQLIIEDEEGTRYTEDGQDIFNEYYDHYQDILRKYIKENK
tara:strand:+ start:175 stop:465 length:291 start_codon:yes stop_codon:yes gene_type:complete